MLDNIDYQELNERVEKAIAQRKKLTRYAMLAVSAFVFVLFAVLSWSVGTGAIGGIQAGEVREDIIAAMVMLTVGGFMAVLMNAIGLMIDSGVGDKQIRSQVLAEVLGEQIKDLAQSEKAKRNEATERLSDESAAEIFELSDDGELVQRKQSK